LYKVKEKGKNAAGPAVLDSVAPFSILFPYGGSFLLALFSFGIENDVAAEWPA
jgi:hypothetical protein